MRHESQTLIGEVRECVNTWRRRNGWSRESIAQHIADEYHKTDGPDLIGIKFEPNTSDVFERAHVNADRIFRWLDDESKDKNLIPPNFIPFIISLMPLDLRIHCGNAILRRSGLVVRVMETGSFGRLVEVFQSLAKEGGEAVASMSKLIDGNVTPEEIAEAKRELTECMAALHAAQEAVAAAESQLA